MSVGIRWLAAFAALSVFVALTWVEMLADPPLGRTALSCLPVLGAILICCRFAPRGCPAGW